MMVAGAEENKKTWKEDRTLGEWGGDTGVDAGRGFVST